MTEPIADLLAWADTASRKDQLLEAMDIAMSESPIRRVLAVIRDRDLRVESEPDPAESEDVFVDKPPTWRQNLGL